MGRFSGKVAIVTASSDGIGLAIAERLAEEGASVMISSRKQSNVDRAVSQLKQKGLPVAGITCHVSVKEQRVALIEKTLAEFGGIDILVSNAANNPIFGQMLDSTTEQGWDKIFDVNVKATFFLVKEIAPYIEKRGGGSVVIVSSQSGYVPNEVMGAYATSKTALLGLTKALVPQLAQMRIRVNCIAPGLIVTKFSEALWNSGEMAKQFKEKIPLKRFAQPSECAGVVAFLVSNDASYITGETITITGGLPNRL